MSKVTIEDKGWIAAYDEEGPTLELTDPDGDELNLATESGERGEVAFLQVNGEGVYLAADQARTLAGVLVKMVGRA